jgi:hypothetical protein
VRGNLLQGLAGVLFLATATFTYFQVRVAQRRLDVERASKDTERFAQAVDQLGDEKALVRIGGIYSLEHVAKESPENYYNPMIEILSAYVRHNSPRTADSVEPEDDRPVKRPVDILAAVMVLGRRQSRPDQVPIEVPIDLRATDLERVDLTGLDFAKADLTEANLTEANLTEANLTGRTCTRRT